MPDHKSERTAVTACTIVARNYLPAARVLASSYRRHNPDHRFVIALIDGGPEDEPRDDNHDVVGPDCFGIDRETYRRMATAYSVTELATSVKPYLLRELRRKSDVAIYIDPDIKFFAPTPEIAELANEQSIVLTPHFLSPLPRDGKEPDEAAIMGAGVFNLGFIAVGPGSEAFLDYWAERLRHDAIVAPAEQLFTDQRWVDLVPALFEHCVLRGRGFNVAYWNLHERTLEQKPDGTLTAAGETLRFFHFSGYRPERPWILTSYCARAPRILLSENPLLRTLCDDYARALKDAGYAETLDQVPYGFARSANGIKFSQSLRRLYRRAWINAEKKQLPLPPHPFGADGGAEFNSWLATPANSAQAAAGLNRLTFGVWESRPDLQAAFPQPLGPDAAGFRQWCRSSGLAEERLPQAALPLEPDVPTGPADDFGVNVLGYLTAELGVGEMGRIVHDTIQGAGIPVTSVLEERLVRNRTGALRPATLAEPRFPLSVIAVNADQTPTVLAHHPAVGHERYRIGVWAWELEEFPEWQHNAFDLVDEVWTISDFCRDAIAKHSPVPVKTIPVPVRDPGSVDRDDLTDGPVTFLFAFDFNSIAQRKNPWGTISAFQRAFPRNVDVRLIIKTINADLHPLDAERLRNAAGDDGRIELVERYLTTAELDELYQRSTCYVSLHRSEGFGLTVAEAMARGIPVIATDYSGTSEFVDENSGWPIPYKLVPVGPGCSPYHPDAVWADPDLDAAAEAMRAVLHDRREAARRGTAARQKVLRERSMANASKWMHEQLRSAYDEWNSRRVEIAETENPLTPMQNAREALRWRPAPDAPAKTPLAPALRKAVLRALDHYDVHQRDVMAALFAGIEDTNRRLLDRIEALEAELGESRHTAARVDHLSRTVDELRGRLPDVGSRIEQVETEVDKLVGVTADLRDGIAASGSTVYRMFQERDERFDRLETADRTMHKMFQERDERLDRLDTTDRTMHKMFQERDERLDGTELSIRDLRRDVAAVHQAARTLHAPLPSGTDVVLCDAGALLLPIDEVVLPWIRHHHFWEYGESRHMAALAAERPGAFLDIGAHVGYHSLKLLQTCSGITSVVAVEADPDIAALLQRNVSVNLSALVAARVQVFAVAAWNAAGEVGLASADSTNSGDNRVFGTDIEIEGRTVPAVRLDSLPEILNERVALVKVDLQGRDHRALDGLHEVLVRDRPDVVCEFCPVAIEELGDDPLVVLAGYRDLGYQVAVVLNDGTHAETGNDEELVRGAREDPKGFVTLWLRP
jgi:FkbM family methyltransferase